MAKIYIDKDGNKITREEWDAYRKDSSYYTVREFKDESVWVRLEWVGVVDTRRHPFASTYPMFKICVFNASSDGMRWVNDPADDGKTYHDKHAAIEGYNIFLLRWTKSQMKDDELIEVGNKLAPPPPPDPNIPKTAVNDDIGCW